jgi:hypothetical protein
MRAAMRALPRTGRKVRAADARRARTAGARRGALTDRPSPAAPAPPPHAQATAAAARGFHSTPAAQTVTAGVSPFRTVTTNTSSKAYPVGEARRRAAAEAARPSPARVSARAFACAPLTRRPLRPLSRRSGPHV